ncbi:hypothetical protein OCV73_04755 [Barnesiella propionica]|uniref:hypothetical protein n=1 Tax=Barnesiella propionica TaxID=2981781 RepID=UPI0011CCD246|nr:hypothetical protein [Barnesiella propionica]MCU6768256.1 hypothetical protein [Barnesiella propionica]
MYRPRTSDQYPIPTPIPHSHPYHYHTIIHTTSSLKNYLSPQSRTAPSQSTRLRYRQSLEAPGIPDV